MTRRVSTARLLLLAVLAFPVAAAAQDPQSASPTTRLIPFAAVLPETGHEARAGARSVTFALFDDVEGGTLLWSETQVVSVDARGRYAAHLGAVTALPLAIFRTEQARWLEVTVDGTALPRTMLVAVPYALRAADAETLGGKALSDFVLSNENGRRVRADGTTVDDPAVDGTGVPNQLAKWNGSTTLSSSIITESADNRIGVLAPDPTGGGVVDSRFTIRHFDNNTAIGVLNTLNQRRFALNTLSNGGFQLFDGAGATWNAGLRQVNGQVSLVGPGGSPKLRVEANGDAAIFLAAQSGSRAVQALGAGFSTGLWAVSSEGTAVLGMAPTGKAGRFVDDVEVVGTLTKGGGSFLIDHPLDPENRYLQHSFVESPDMMNVYNGNVTLDANGEAWITLPDWFGALNRDFRYQLTAVGAPGPNLHIASEIRNNRFRIAGGIAGGRVSWQVTGIRHDPWANANRVVVERAKPGHDRGLYLHPRAYNVPSEKGVPAVPERKR